MKFKTGISLLMDILVQAFSLTQLTKKSKNNIADVIQDQMKTVLLGLVSATVLCFCMIYSLILVMQKLNAVLLTTENGTLFSILFFSTLLLGSSTAAFFLLKPKSKDAEREIQNDLDPKAILISFLEGLSEGLAKPRAKSAETEAPVTRLVDPLFDDRMSI